MTIQDDNSSSESFCRDLLNVDKSIRFVGLANKLGSLVATSYRQNLVPLMTREETSLYAVQAVLRATTREDFESKIGRLEYSIGKYQKLIRATIPILSESGDKNEAKFYLLLSFDVDSDAKSIIEHKIMDIISDEKSSITN
jgi:hypothetical protein